MSFDENEERVNIGMMNNNKIMMNTNMMNENNMTEIRHHTAATLDDNSIFAIEQYESIFQQ